MKYRNSKRAGINHTLPITLNINRLNIPIKRQRLEEKKA